jgi:hypothetical protein
VSVYGILSVRKSAGILEFSLSELTSELALNSAEFLRIPKRDFMKFRGISSPEFWILWFLEMLSVSSIRLIPFYLICSNFTQHLSCMKNCVCPCPCPCPLTVRVHMHVQLSMSMSTSTSSVLVRVRVPVYAHVHVHVHVLVNLYV